MKTRTKIGIGATAGAGVAFRAIRRRERSGMEWATRRVRYLKALAQDERYRLTGSHPDPAVSDDILADRVRSQLGPVGKQLETPTSWRRPPPGSAESRA